MGWEGITQKQWDSLSFKHVPYRSIILINQCIVQWEVQHLYSWFVWELQNWFEGINYLFESYCPKALTTPRAAPELQPRGPETMATVYDPWITLLIFAQL